jgi:predicted MFS family arabinose efflux permease
MTGVTAASSARAVAPYLVAATLARIADEMVGVAVVLLVIDRTGSIALAGAMVTAYTVPSLVSGPLLGAWLDRTRHRRAALAGNEIVLAAVVTALAVLAGRAPAATLLALAALAGVTLPLTSGGFSSLLPSLVPAAALNRVTALDAAVFSVASVAGPALAGTIAATLGSGAAVTVLGAVAALAAACVPGIRPARVPDAAGDATPLLVAVRAGVRHVLGTPPLRGATLASAIGLGATGMLTTALPARAEQLGAGRAAAGYVWAAIEVGAMVALLAVGRRLHRWRPERTVFLAVAGGGAVTLAWPVAGLLPVLLSLALFAGLAGGPNLAALLAARQRYSPARLLGQVSTTGASLKLAAFAAGSALGGQLVPVLGTATVITGVGVVQLAGAGAGWLSASGGRPRRPADRVGHIPRLREARPQRESR